MPCSCFELRHIQTKECKRKRPPFQCLQPDMPHCCRLHPLRHCFSQLQPGCLEAAANAARWPRSPPSDSNLLITFKAGNFEAKGLKIMCMYIYIYCIQKGHQSSPRCTFHEVDTRNLKDIFRTTAQHSPTSLSNSDSAFLASLNSCSFWIHNLCYHESRSGV